ncbi:MAG: S-layer homology domain-containing protein [Butyricicoccus sp.]
MKKRLLASLLAMVMLLTMLPGAALAADCGGGKPDHGSELKPGEVQASKSASYDAETGKVTITLEVNGSDITQTEKTPADVVLVVDNSGSMDDWRLMECGAGKNDYKKITILKIGKLEINVYRCANCGAFRGLTKPIFGCFRYITKLTAAQKSAYELVEKLAAANPDNRIALVSFAGDKGGVGKGAKNPELNNKACIGLTKADSQQNVEKLYNTIDAMKADGGTNYTAALAKAEEYLTGSTNPYVIFISDGAPGRDGTSAGDIRWNGMEQAEALKQAGTTIYTIGLNVKGNVLSRLATSGEGYSANFTNMSKINQELPALVEKIAAEILTTTKHAGTDAVLTDVISDQFTLDEIPEELAGQLDKTADGTVAWTIGDIDGQKKISFTVTPKEGVFGEDIPTNKEAVLSYTDAAKQKKELPVDTAKVTIPEPSEPTPPEETEKAIYAAFKISDGSWTDSVPAENAKQYTLYSTTPDAKLDIPAVTAPEGKELSHWTNDVDAEKTLPATGEFTYNDFKDIVTFGEGGKAYIGWTAVFKDAQSPEGPTDPENKINVHFYIANLESGYYTVNGETMTEYNVQASYRVDFPELTVNDGYELTGWQVDGKYSAVWDAAATEAIGIEGLASDSGDLAIAPVIRKKGDPVDPEGTIYVHFYIADWESGSYELSDGENAKYWNTTADSEGKVVFPTFKLADGYKLTGWQVEGKTTTTLDKDTAELSGLADLANNGHISIHPIVAKDDSEGGGSEGGGSEGGGSEGGDPDAEFTVTFDSNGGTAVASQTVKNGEKAVKPTNPTRSGYTFGGWYTDDNKKWDFNDPITGDITLTASWTKNSSGGGSSSTKTYKIAASTDGSGSISPSGNTYVNSGSSKTFTMTPAANYVVKDVLVDGKSVGAVSKYTFENVRENHTIHVTFSRKGSVADPSDTGVSAKLDTENHMKYMVGYPDGSFGPGRNMTRAEAAQMFYNLLLDKNTANTVRFTDVKDDAWYAEAVRTLAGMGVISGYGDGRFQPGKSVTRAEFTAMSMRFAKDASGQNIFSDVKSSAWYYGAVMGSVAYGWVNGYGDGTFRADETITRAEVVTIVNNMLGRSADQDYIDSHTDTIAKFTDLNNSHWAYYNIMEATNAHDHDKKNDAEEWTRLK